MIASTPSASAFVTATVMPRSLNDPVGFWPSHLRYSSTPGATTAASRSARTSGVFPSFRVTIFSVGPTGSRSRYCSISPPQARATLMGARYYYQRFAGLQHIRGGVTMTPRLSSGSRWAQSIEYAVAQLLEERRQVARVDRVAQVQPRQADMLALVQGAREVVRVDGPLARGVLHDAAREPALVAEADREARGIPHGVGGRREQVQIE